MTFSEIRESVHPGAYDELVITFRDNPFYRLKIFGEPFPRSPAQFKRLQPLQGLGATREILWAESLIKHHSDILSAMWLMRTRIVEFILNDSYETALGLLDEMEAAHGVSMWGYSIRFFCRSRTLGQDANNVVYTDLRKTQGINGLTYFLLFYIGFRMSPGSTVQHIRSQMPAAGDVGGALATYMRHKLTPFSYDGDLRHGGLVEALLRHETNASAFDLLCAYNRASALAIERDGVPRQIVAESFQRVGLAIGEISRAASFKAVAGSEAPPFSARTAAVLDSLDAIVCSGMHLGSGLLDRLLEALGWKGKQLGGLSDEVRSALGVLAQGVGDREASAAELERLCTAISGIDEAICVFEISRRLWLGPTIVSLFGSLDGVLASGCVLPDIAEFIAEETEALRFLDSFELIYGQRPSIELFRLRRGAPGLKVHPKLDPYVTAVRLSVEGRHHEALITLQSSLAEGALAIGVLALRARLQLATGLIDDAICTIANAYLDDASVWASMPVAEVADSVISAGFEPSNVLAWSVTLDIATRHIDDKYARRRSFAVEDAWESRNVSAPSELAVALNKDEQALGIYYLRILCTSHTLSDSDRFQSVRQLEEERIRVCQALVELDPTNAQSYLSEIKTVTRWLVIYDGLRSIEQSKVYVDIEGLKAYLMIVAGPEYERMMALRRERSAIGNVDDLISKDVVTYRDDEIIGSPLFTLYAREPTKILRYLIVQVCSEYASNSRFGLDVYLSTRVRHGTLKGHLRSPLEDNRLICQRNGTEYRDQPFWCQRILDLSGQPEAALLDGLREFSAQVDGDIADLNDRYLRLRSSTSPDGWIDLTPVETDLVTLDRYIEVSQPSFSRFLDTAFVGLNDALEHQLGVVRWRLSLDLRRSWSLRLRELREAGQQVTSGQLRSEFDSAVAGAQVSVDIALERVAGWFTLSTAQDSPDYTIELAIDIAARSVENCFGSNVLIIEPQEGESPYLRGRTLASLVDVFFILFENIVKHARTGASVRADVSVARKERFYTITVRNSLDENVDLAALTSRVAVIKESLRVENETRLVTEGGTGYHKLRKILGHDLRLEHDFDFGVTEGVYEVTILVDAAAVLL